MKNLLLSVTVFFAGLYICQGQSRAVITGTTEMSPFSRVMKQPPAVKSKGVWDVMFSFKAAGYNEAGVESDGNYIYTSSWSGNQFYRYSFAGEKLDSFSISGFSNSYIRDLAYDGTYFYGGIATDVIYKMDFTNHSIVGTIKCPGGTMIRSIAWDSDLGGFWVANWNSDIICVSPAGSLIATIPSANHGLTGMYGSAYDNLSAGGPYLWVYDQKTTTGTGGVFHQIKISTKMPTGITHDCIADIGASLADVVAGGAFCRVYNGNVMLGGLLQKGVVFGYSLGAYTSVKDIPAEKNSGIYPNPCSSWFEVNIKGLNYGSGWIIRLYDISGKPVAESRLNENCCKINVSNLSRGMYFYKITGGGGILMGKGVVVKE